MFGLFWWPWWSAGGQASSPPASTGRVIPGSLWQRNQWLGPFTPGEDLSFQITGTTTSDPTAWTVRFSLVDPSGNVLLTVASPTVTVSATGSGSAFFVTFAAPVSHTQSAALPAGTLGWQLDRTDAGSEWVLAGGGGQAGGVEALAPLNPLP